MNDPKRREKKSETLEVRIPHSKKEAFMAACEGEGITASHAIRTFIDAYLVRSRRMKVQRIAKDIANMLIKNPLKTSGMAGAGLAALVMFSAQPSMADTDAFAHLDKTGDGILTDADFADIGGDTDIATMLIGRLDENGDGTVTRSEFDASDAKVVHREIEVTETEGDGPRRHAMIMISDGEDGPALTAEQLEELTEGDTATWTVDGEGGQRFEFRSVEKREKTETVEE